MYLKHRERCSAFLLEFYSYPPKCDLTILKYLIECSRYQLGRLAKVLLCVGRIQNRTQIKRVNEFALMEEKSNQRGVSALTSDCIDKRCQIGGCCVEFDLNSSEFRCWYVYVFCEHPQISRTKKDMQGGLFSCWNTSSSVCVWYGCGYDKGSRCSWSACEFAIAVGKMDVLLSSLKARQTDFMCP